MEDERRFKSTVSQKNSTVELRQTIPVFRHCIRSSSMAKKNQLSDVVAAVILSSGVYTTSGVDSWSLSGLVKAFYSLH
jgi:hypothetical protein